MTDPADSRSYYLNEPHAPFHALFDIGKRVFDVREGSVLNFHHVKAHKAVRQRVLNQILHRRAADTPLLGNGHRLAAESAVRARANFDLYKYDLCAALRNQIDFSAADGKIARHNLHALRREIVCRLRLARRAACARAFLCAHRLTQSA